MAFPLLGALGGGGGVLSSIMGGGGNPLGAIMGGGGGQGLFGNIFGGLTSAMTGGQSNMLGGAAQSFMGPLAGPMQGLMGGAGGFGGPTGGGAFGGSSSAAMNGGSSPMGPTGGGFESAFGQFSGMVDQANKRQGQMFGMQQAMHDQQEFWQFARQMQNFKHEMTKAAIGDLKA
jgi:hypothetical protein